VPVDQLNEVPRQPVLGVEGAGVDPALVRQPQPVQDGAQQHDRHPGIRLDELPELPARQHQALRRLDDLVARGSRPRVDGLELAHQIAGAQQGEHRPATVDRVERDLHPALEQNVHGVGVVALEDDRHTPREPAPAPIGDEVGPVVRVELRHEPLHRLLGWGRAAATDRQ
jgi:hypothetical protein